MTVGKKWKQSLNNTVTQLLTGNSNASHQHHFNIYLRSYIECFCTHFNAYNSDENNYIVSGSKQQYLTNYNGIDFLPNGKARNISIYPTIDQDFILHILQYVIQGRIYNLSKLIKIINKIIYTEFYHIDKLPEYLAFLVVLQKLHYRNCEQAMTMYFYVNDNSEGYKQIKFIWKPSSKFDILKAKLSKLFKIT